MSRIRTDRSPARRVLAVCAMTGAALLTTLTGGQAWADGAPKPTPAAPGGAVPAPAVSRPAATPTPAAPGGAAPTATPTPAAPGRAAPTATPAAVPSPVPGGTGSQVREVPKGAAQAGDGSSASDGSGLMLAGGGAVAAVGAGALGFAVLRRRSGARG
ncbi:hypothetical protein [Kitasatospora sp. SUK 42]|uniref:hypothetical protein n=1 Tax=Kitasatospora sp. SUK 42 TaxID=1588882 RepID=UPI001C312A02|nr:hypothetical protein [Kitasatospora sp. SUK 42]MBV2154637.1 hypothetical protein [Kitasatospora sp. SUK 42]